ncbi:MULTISPECIES: hypothetical protein [Vibrio]|uniref:hypothetical protein n=1 Tax=Vibrio TaxID=662 RepID=UPI000C83B2A1|nr:MULTISPECIES: hypothetical protein [Vibrio]PMH40121.1 hypothetical protein BCU69_16630 [Vibrio cyclitrophicus]TMX35021.1 hypothetical protein DA098_21310 [Vibrio parahaemolyticus]TMX78297.1 hypothetical protein DA094_11280 [Vibrio parahaemolyticus]
MSQVKNDPRFMTLEELKAKHEQEFQIRKEFLEKSEKINETVENLLALTDEVEIQIAVNELLPFITKNIDKAESKLRDRLAVVVESEEEATDKPAKKSGSKNRITFQLFNIENFQAEAPNLYKYLVENEDAKPLEANDQLLVVRRKPFSDAVKEAAAKDTDVPVKDLLNQLFEREAKFLPDSEEAQNSEKQPIDKFKMRK